MTTADIRQRAVQWRNCGLPGDAELLDALADVVEAAQDRTDWRQVKLSDALARVEAIQP